MGIQLAPQQKTAYDEMQAWYNQANDPIFRLFGYAGTGKTTMARMLAGVASGPVVYCAYTGKAAVVMRKSGCRGAMTIHSAVYKAKQNKATGEWRYIWDAEGVMSEASLIVTDECSMVDEALAADMLKFGKPILALGDPFQLPPVGNSAGFFTKADPNFMLTEIHRQAEGNPIIKLATDVRQGRGLTPGRYGESEVIQGGGRLDTDAVKNADQVLVGKNNTRQAYNSRLRELNGFGKKMKFFPESGEKVICLRNNKNLGIFNGGMYRVLEHRDPGRRGCITLLVQSEDFKKSEAIEVDIREEFFTGNPKELDWRLKSGTAEFDFGYAVTVHKAQGSQWDSVFLFDQGEIFRDDADRWLYTGITRAAKRISVVI